ncbi:MAG TPA: DUF4476 domain-containing protein [Bacteroidia bacterium]|jgi:hypothetical protein|nr:DUF4476 domain-containing protein [Bacteroidia bacterium]
MKKVIIIQMLAGSFTMPALANNWNSQLSLSNYDHQKFVMYFDNSYFSTPSNTYNVTDITPGRHHIRMLTPAQNYGYGNCGMPSLLYDGYVDFPANAMITAYAASVNNFNITSSYPLVQNGNWGDPNYNTGYGNAGGNNGWYGDAGYGNNGNDPYGNWGGNSSGNGGYNNYPQYYGMNDQQFNSLKSAIQSKAFDSSRLTIAEQASSSNYLTAEQVYELAQLFDFESTKLDFAKYAYARVVDKGNYYVVNNAFTFESSITDLAGFVNTYHG